MVDSRQLVSVLFLFSLFCSAASVRDAGGAVGWRGASGVGVEGASGVGVEGVSEAVGGRGDVIPTMSA